MPIYEIRYKNRELWGGKRIVEEANIQRAFLKAHDVGEEADIEAVREIATKKEELKYALSTAFLNIANYGLAGTDLADRWEELTPEDIRVFRTLLSSIQEWADRVGTYLRAYEDLF
jgi:hypothetical protein